MEKVDKNKLIDHIMKSWCRLATKKFCPFSMLRFTLSLKKQVHVFSCKKKKCCLRLSCLIKWHFKCVWSSSFYGVVLGGCILMVIRQKKALWDIWEYCTNFKLKIVCQVCTVQCAFFDFFFEIFELFEGCISCKWN